MPFILDALHTYIFVKLIEQFGIFVSSLILTALVYLIGFPFYLGLKGIFPSRSRLFLTIYCFTATGIGSLPFWAGPGLGVSYNLVLTIPILLLPFGVYYFFIFLDKIGILRLDRHSPSNLYTTLFLIILFTVPVVTVIDWALLKGQYICTKTGEISVLLVAFGLPAIGAFIFLLLLMPIVGLVSLMSAIVGWLTKERPSNSES